MQLVSFLSQSRDVCASWWYQISKLEYVLDADVNCIQGLHLWRNSSSEINNELYKGYRKGNSEGKINEIVAGLPIRICKWITFIVLNLFDFYPFLFLFHCSAYDFLNSDQNNFNVSIWYNSTYKNDSGNAPIALTRVPRSVNMVFFSYPGFTLIISSERLYYTIVMLKQMKLLKVSWKFVYLLA